MILTTVRSRLQAAISKFTQLPVNRPIQNAAYAMMKASDGVSIQDLPKSDNFTAHLPPDPEYRTPSDSFDAPREDLGPRLVKGALYTFVRPEITENPELLAVSHTALKDIGLKEGEEETQDFKALVAGNKFFWDKDTKSGIYPWAQCYGGTPSSELIFC